jgi:5'-nucleotidase
MNILVTNDDGIESRSLPLLIRQLKKFARVLAVVPDREMSGASHSITLTRPLRCRQVSKDVHTLDGTPTDCVNIVLLGGLPFPSIDLVVSGVNQGPNMSEDVFYSGTVAGAREGALFGLPAVAVSLQTDRREPDFSYAADFTARFVRAARWRPGLLLNVNIPDRPGRGIRGVKVTRLGNRQYHDALIKRRDPWGDPYFWLKGTSLTYARTKGTDYYEVKRGFISVTPLTLDITDRSGTDCLPAAVAKKFRRRS